jgi:hypothetical protein
MMEKEPAWMEGVRERDAMFGLAPTEYKDTMTWVGVVIACANDDNYYFVPGFLSRLAKFYAARDGWQEEGDRLICPKCAKEMPR